MTKRRPTAGVGTRAWRRSLVGVVFWLFASLVSGAVEEIQLADNPSRGNLEAPLVLVEFVDYQSPYCAKAARETLPRIYEHYIEPGKVRHVVMDLVLEVARPAHLAAGAAECARRQGRFWELHQRLLEDPGAVAQPVKAGQALGLDPAAMVECLSGGSAGEAARRDADEARRLGVGGVPTFIVAAADPARPETVRVIEMVPGARLAPLQEAIETALAAPPVAVVSTQTTAEGGPDLKLHAVELVPDSVSLGQKATLEWDLTATGVVADQPIEVELSYETLQDGNLLYRSEWRTIQVRSGIRMRKSIQVATGPRAGRYTLVAKARWGELEESSEKSFQVR